MEGHVVLARDAPHLWEVIQGPVYQFRWGFPAIKDIPSAKDGAFVLALESPQLLQRTPHGCKPRRLLGPGHRRVEGQMEVPTKDG